MSTESQVRSDVARLLKEGARLSLSLRKATDLPALLADWRRRYGEGAEEFVEGLPDFQMEYQSWYSEASLLVKIFLPDRLSDFRRLYEKPKERSVFNHESCCIEDALLNVQVVIDGRQTDIKAWVIPLVEQQYAIVRAVEQNLASSIAVARQMIQRDIFESEFDSARELVRCGYLRAAGMIGGVLLERHLSQICEKHALAITKKHPTISDFNDLLKENGLIDLSAWRFHQHLADIRNLCGHARGDDPTRDQIEDLLSGVRRVVDRLI